jgi:hypothetical protein
MKNSRPDDDPGLEDSPALLQPDDSIPLSQLDAPVGVQLDVAACAQLD